MRRYVEIIDNIIQYFPQRSFSNKILARYNHNYKKKTSHKASENELKK